MKFLVDVNIGVSVVNDLKAAGHEAVYVAAIDFSGMVERVIIHEKNTLSEQRERLLRSRK